MKKGRTIALLPILVFLVLYLGLGLLFEYGMKIPMGFYNIPIVVVFLVALLVACLQNRSLSFDRKLELMGQGIGDKNRRTRRLWTTRPRRLRTCARSGRSRSWRATRRRR